MISCTLPSMQIIEAGLPPSFAGGCARLAPMLMMMIMMRVTMMMMMMMATDHAPECHFIISSRVAPTKNKSNSLLPTRTRAPRNGPDESRSKVVTRGFPARGWAPAQFGASRFRRVARRFPARGLVLAAQACIGRGSPACLRPTRHTW